MVLHILSGDIQIADRMVELPTQSDLDAMNEHVRGKWEKLIKLLDDTISEQGVERGQKAKISYEQFQAFSRATAGLPGNTEPGGSSGNTLTTLSRILPGKVAVDMFGVVGRGDPNSERIRGDLVDTKINLIPEKYPDGLAPESATSFVFKEPGGKRTIVTYTGNARDILKPSMVTPELIQKNDVVFVQGSLWEKLDEDFPNELCKLRYNGSTHDAKEMWLALPTHAKFRDNMPPARYRYLIPSADVVLSNDEELKRIYETKDFRTAVHDLQSDISKRDEVLAHDHKLAHIKQPVAFITCGKEGAVVVTPDGDPKYIAPPDVSGIEKLYALGSGDNAYAGFLAGHIAGLTPEQSGTLGMQVAGAKLAFDGARMPEPREAVRAFSSTGKILLEEVDHNIEHNRNLIDPRDFQQLAPRPGTARSQGISSFRSA